VSLRAAFAAAVALVIIAFLPPPEIVRALAPKWLLHATVFAVFTFAWMLGLPRVSVLWIAPVILVFGFLHEAIEIVGHGHRFELRDALDNAAGTIAGALAGLAARRPRIS
jgi:hypothetical protein